ncbi:unnamed protein product [Cyprideis torosa]|uniref:Uncharacterized protein n=1 Tax=Cyprideis torosa TaxID=163714 RepID=A0A7R8WDV0_9CRUS|nr:unnamed protein product [Cyprideis torosa]CAG0889993.1 unnamed protein product [Cyprideis torosa]
MAGEKSPDCDVTYALRPSGLSRLHKLEPAEQVEEVVCNSAENHTTWRPNEHQSRAKPFSAEASEKQTEELMETSREWSEKFYLLKLYQLQFQQRTNEEERRSLRERCDRPLPWLSGYSSPGYGPDGGRSNPPANCRG